MMYQDNITVASHNLSSVPFAVCDNVSTGLLSGNVSGVMGLGFTPLASSGVTPFWQSLLDSPSAANFSFSGFSFALTRFGNDSGASLTEFGGIFTLGTLQNDSFVNGTLNFFNVPANLQSYWLIPMQGITLQNVSLPGVGTPNAAIDTGTTLIGGPHDVVSQLYSKIPGAQTAGGQYTGYYTYPCNANVSIGFVFGGITYMMASDDFNLGTFTSATATTPATCLGAFFDLQLSARSASVIQWVIGDAFLKNVYSAYRYKPGPSVGFAKISPGFAILSPRSNSTHGIPSVHTSIFGPEATGVSAGEANGGGPSTQALANSAVLPSLNQWWGMITLVVSWGSLR